MLGSYITEIEFHKTAEEKPPHNKRLLVKYRSSLVDGSYTMIARQVVERDAYLLDYEKHLWYGDGGTELPGEPDYWAYLP